MSDSQSPAATRTRLIAIGASAGGLAPLRTIMGTLPRDLPATVLVVVHMSSTATSVLPEILARSSDLGVTPARDREELWPGRVIVARPDRHLLVQDGHVCLDRGPRVNGHRPAVDALFRSAAMEYGPACCGVVLSGSRDDGAAGLADIKAHGGAAIVQDPHEAQYDGMPANALAGTTVDYMLPATEIAEVLVRLAVRGRVPGPVQKAEENSARPPEMLSVLCPECGGTLFQDDQGGFVQFHCHVGHRFAARSLLAAHAEGVERAMWTAMRSLEDRATLLRRMAAGMSERGAITAASLEAQAASADEQARAIRDAIAALDDSEIGSVPDDEETLP